jgi:uncharacterized protein
VKKKKVLDAFAMLAYLKKEHSSEKVKAEFSSDGVSIIMNEINVGEVFYIIARARGMEKAEYFVNTILPSLPMSCVTNKLGDVLDAARIKAVHAISYADSFAVATAIKEKAPVITGDPEFKKVEKIVRVEWM